MEAKAKEAATKAEGAAVKVGDAVKEKTSEAVEKAKELAGKK